MPLPSVSKRFNSLVAPALLAIGFVASGKSYWRVKGDVFQALFLHTETRIRREFLIEYCTFLISVPHAHHTLELGGRFPVGTSGTWYPADTPERLEVSMNRVHENIPKLIDWFRGSETLGGYLRTYVDHIAKQPTRLIENGHTSFALACGHATAGDFEFARRCAVQALTEFEAILASYRAAYPTHDHWAPEWINRARALIAAIDSSSVDLLLEEWRAFTVSALKIHR